MTQFRIRLDDDLVVTTGNAASARREAEAGNPVVVIE